VTFLTFHVFRIRELCSIIKTNTAMKHEVDAQWMGKMQFNALVNGHTVIMDAPARVGGEDLGSIPKPFVLTALAGCTGMDVVALLRKAGIELEHLDINVSGEITKTPPIAYANIHVTYTMRGADAHLQDALAVVQRSQNEICGVSYMLKKAMPVTWSVAYNGKEIFNNAAVEA
jgi:putative redox protein